MRMPLEAAIPEPTMTAVGAASPTAQGHAITSTLIPAEHSRVGVSLHAAGTMQATTRHALCGALQLASITNALHTRQRAPNSSANTKSLLSAGCQLRGKELVTPAHEGQPQM